MKEKILTLENQVYLKEGSVKEKFTHVFFQSQFSV